MYLISYDIDKDKARIKIAKTLEDYGRRVQYSVFECDLTQQKYEELYVKLTSLMSAEIEGSIRCYQLCKTCEAKTVIIGCDAPDRGFADDGLIII